MAASPEFLALLDQQKQLRPLPTDFQALDRAWNDLTDHRDHDALTQIADIAIDLFVQEGGAPNRKAAIELFKDTHVRKNAGYAGADNPDSWANFRMAADFGISAFDGVLVRMSDKYIRLTNLRRNPANEQTGEAVVDTLLDLGSYALIADCLLDEEQAA